MREVRPRFHKINQIPCNLPGMKKLLAPALLVFAGLGLASPAAAQADFGSCLAGLRSQAAAKGISGQAFDAATRGITPDLTILDLMSNQPEFKTAIWDYLAALVDDERVQDGRTAMRQWGQALAAAEARFGVDGDGDGRRDIMASVPDAVHSTANFLKKAGWVNGLPWGYEVRLPANFNSGLAGRKNKKPLATWAAIGVRRVDGRPLEGSYAAGIIIPAGVNGPAFIVTKNFDAVYSYNAAESYGVAIALLGDRLKGQPGIQTAWPTDDPPLSRAERRELQRLL